MQIFKRTIGLSNTRKLARIVFSSIKVFRYYEHGRLAIYIATLGIEFNHDLIYQYEYDSQNYGTISFYKEKYWVVLYGVLNQSATEDVSVRWTEK